MKAVITGEGDQLVGLNLLDNNGTEHVIEMQFDGEIENYQQYGYPDHPSDRPLRESEFINQTSRFARYWVYRQREYKTVEPWKNPDLLPRTTLILASISRETMESEFEGLYHQLRSHTTETDPVVPLPEGVVGHNITYKKDVYIRSPEELQGRIDSNSVISQIDQLREAIVDESSVGVTDLEEILERVAVDDLIHTISGLQLHWDDTTGQYQTRRTDEPDIEREPDARIELLPFAPDSLDELHLRMVRNLICQVRDRYVGMGVTPPEPFRVQGLGAYDFSTWYDTYDFYQRYHDPDATIDWLAPEPEEHRRERDDDFYY